MRVLTRKVSFGHCGRCVTCMSLCIWIDANDTSRACRYPGFTFDRVDEIRLWGIEGRFSRGFAQENEDS